MSNDSTSPVHDSSSENSSSSNDSISVTESTASMEAGTSSSSSSTSSSTTKTSSDENEQISTTDTRRRVKLYMLNANRTWDDRGTGHVSSSYVERLNGMSLLVKAESDGSLLLESRILADTAYQKQQDTLIVWSEGENYDLALSFQERVGCEEIWAKICQVQGKDPSVDFTQDIIEDDDNELPPCEVDRLDEINSIIASSLTLQNKKDSVTLALETESYISRLLQLFRQLEEKKDIQALLKLHEIFKNIFLLNRNSLFDIMLSEDALWDVIGVFEYDPTGAAVREANAAAEAAVVSPSPGASVYGSPDVSEDRSKPSSPIVNHIASTSSQSSPVVNRALSNSNSFFSSLPSSSETELMRLVREKRHREFLRNVSRFKEVIPLGKSELVSRIHQTYRVQYIQDVILPTPSVFEDNMLSTLSSFIFLNKVEIVNLIQEDDKFLKELFSQLADDSPAFSEKRRDLVLFLKELCTFSHALQLQSRELFIKTLSSLGLLHTIELLLSSEDPAIKLGAVDILIYVVDYSPSMVREYALQQEINSDKKEKYIINIIIEQMICDIDPDLGMATQLSGILKMLIDPENMLTTSGMNKSEKSEFLNYFYKNCIHYLTSPILASTVESSTDRPIEYRLGFEQTCQSAQLLAIILELLTFCIEHHAYHIRSYLLPKEIVLRIMVLTKSKHTFLILSVIRFIRRLIGLKDEFYNRHIVSGNLLAPIIDVFLANKGRYNLLDSAVIDLFEFINSSQINTLCNYTIENFWKGKLERIDYVRTFKCMRNYYEQQNQLRDRLDSQSLLFSRNRFRRDPRQLDKEEDMWFNADEDDEEEDCADDDDEDECENYHDDDEDSPPRSGLAVNDASSHFHQYGSQMVGASGALQKPQFTTSLASSGHQSPQPHPHQLHHGLSSLHHHQQQVSSTTSVSLTSYHNQTTSSTSSSSSSPPSHHLSTYESPSSAFVDSPFFSSFSSKKKSADRKTLTINLNSKTSSFISSVNNNISHLQNSISPQQNFSAFSSAGGGGNLNHSLSPSNISNNNHHHSSFVSKSFSPTSASTSVLAGQVLHQQSNIDPVSTKDNSSSRKALVDYPDEDSDEEDADEEDEIEDDDDIENDDDEDDMLKCESAFSPTTGCSNSHTNRSNLRAKSAFSPSVLSPSTSTTPVSPLSLTALSSQHCPNSLSNVSTCIDNGPNPTVLLSNPVVNSSNSSDVTIVGSDHQIYPDSDASLQSRTFDRISSCVELQYPVATTTGVASASATLTSHQHPQQDQVSSSKSEVSSSFHHLSPIVGHSGDSVDNESATISTMERTVTGKRRLSDDDETKVTMSDESTVSTGSSDESSSSNSSSDSASATTTTSSSSTSSSISKRFKYSFVQSGAGSLVDDGGGSGSAAGDEGDIGVADDQSPSSTVNKSNNGTGDVHTEQSTNNSPVIVPTALSTDNTSSK